MAVLLKYFWLKENVFFSSCILQGKQVLSVIWPILLQAAGRNESLVGQNMEKKARWREEFQKEREAAVALSEKAQ